MKNIKNTNQYIQVIKIVLISIFFVVASPLAVLADDYTYGGDYDTYTYGGSDDVYTYGGDYDTYTYGGDYDTYTYGGDYDTYTYGGNDDIYTYGGDGDTYTYGGSDDVYTYGGDYDTYTYGGSDDVYTYGGDYDTYTTVSSGDYYGGGYTYTPTTYYDYPTSVVSSGGFYGGTTYINPPAVYTQPTSYVTSGSFSGGTTYINPPAVYVQSPSVVTSGGFSGGTTYVTPTTYYNQPPSVVSSGGFSGGNSSYYYPQSTTIPNQILSYTMTNPGLSSVYLSEVPNTGFSDYSGTIIFISLLLSWSAILAYVFLKKKIEAQMPFANVLASTNTIIEASDTNDSVTSNLANQIASDNSDISKVEEYARMNKVLLSSDAVLKLIKLSRLGQINVSGFIKKIATSEWVAVGEEQIK